MLPTGVGEEATRAATPGTSQTGFWLSVVVVYGFLAAAVAVAARASGSFGLVLLGFLAIGWLQYVIIHGTCQRL